MRGGKRLAIWAGIVAPLIAIGAILVSTLLAGPETFTWQGRALSHMGVPGTRTFPLFNGGLIISGFVGLPFGWLCWQRSRNWWERVGVGLLSLTILGMVGVGVFFVGHTAYYLPNSLHVVAAALVFVGAPFAQYVYGTGFVIAGDRRFGLATIWLGIVHPFNWLFWLLSIQGTDGIAWFAVAEFVPAVVLAGWIFVLAIRQRRLEGASMGDDRPDRTLNTSDSPV